MSHEFIDVSIVFFFVFCFFGGGGVYEGTSIGKSVE